MPYDVRITRAAERAIGKLPAAAQAAILKRLEELADDPRPHDAKKLGGVSATARVYRVRLRIARVPYRIIYQVRDKEAWVLVLKVGDRKEVYDRIGDLKRLLR